jgi:hypothetical protein
MLSVFAIPMDSLLLLLLLLLPCTLALNITDDAVQTNEAVSEAASFRCALNEYIEGVPELVGLTGTLGGSKPECAATCTSVLACMSFLYINRSQHCELWARVSVYKVSQ